MRLNNQNIFTKSDQKILGCNSPKEYEKARKLINF